MELGLAFFLLAGPFYFPHRTARRQRYLPGNGDALW